jgi:hypothetical protein
VEEEEEEEEEEASWGPLKATRTSSPRAGPPP